MPPKKKLNSVNVGIEERMKYKEEIQALKTVIEEKNDSIKALEEEMKSLKMRHFEAFDIHQERGKKEVDNLKRKLTIVDKLKEKIECPVCLEIPRAGPVPVCPNGHLVCQECNRGTTCPTCRVRMGTGKSILATTIIENIEHKCKFVDCDDYFPVDKVEEHIKVCPHRIVSCPYGNCAAKVGLSKLMDHLNKEDCSAQSFPFSLEMYHDVPHFPGMWNIKEELQCAANAVWKLNTFSFNDASFCIFLEKKDGMYFVCCLMFSSENECSKYKIEMAAHEEGSTSEDSEVCLKFAGKPVSIDRDRKDFMDLGLLVSGKAIEKMLRKSRMNIFRLSFSIRKTS